MGKKDWNIPIEFRGKVINISRECLGKQRRYIGDFLSREPEESLEEIEAQIRLKSFWQQLRSCKEWLVVAILPILPFLAYDGWKWKSKAKTLKKKTDTVDTVILVLTLGILSTLPMLIYMFY